MKLRMKLKTLPVLLLLPSACVYATDVEEGKALYESVALERTIRGEVYSDANCETCHSSDIYTRPNRRVNTYPRLEAQVEMCNTMLDVGWFPDEVSAVATYLNQKYYKFD